MNKPRGCHSRESGNPGGQTPSLCRISLDSGSRPAALPGMTSTAGASFRPFNYAQDKLQPESSES
jgi:hypothetical protein